MWLRCNLCKAAVPYDRLYGGLCLSCLRQRITYDEGLRYLMAKDFLGYFLDGVTGIRGASTPGLLMEFLDLEIDDVKTGRTAFLDRLRDYILEDGICARDFAEWLEGRDAS